MKTLRLFGLVVFLVCMVVMCWACGGPKFNSIKDVDCFVEKERLKTRKFNEPKINIRNKGIPQRVSTGNRLLEGLDMALSGPVGTAAMLMSYKPTVSGKNLYLQGSVYFKRYYTIYRMKDGNISKDISSAAIKTIKEKPESSCCNMVAIAIRPSKIFKHEYHGEDGQIVASLFLEVYVNFSVKDSIERNLSEEDWKPYLDYLNKVCSNIKEMIEKDFKNPSPYCPGGGI